LASIFTPELADKALHINLIIFGILTKGLDSCNNETFQGVTETTKKD
jgi:hypothetical protein